MEKKVRCGAKSIQDCLNCNYPDCIASDKEIMEMEHKRQRRNSWRREYYERHKTEEISRTKRWNASHKEQIKKYNREWMKAYRAKQKEAAV